MTPSRIPWRWIGVAVVVSAAWLVLRPHGEPAAEPVDWRTSPVQTATTRAPIVLETRKGRITLTPRAAYDLSAIVASTERYWIDPSAFLSPLDAAVVWGPVGDPKVRKAIDFYQANRFCIWSTRLEFPRPDTIPPLRERPPPPGHAQPPPRAAESRPWRRGPPHRPPGRRHG